MQKYPMKRPIAVLTVGMLSLTAAQAGAQDVAGRYAMQKTDTGIARLDTQTGEVSLCREQDGQMVCRMAADERTAFELELDLLTKRVETLENAGSSLRNAIPRLPTNEEIDQTMTIMERMMRSFMGIVKDLDSEPPTGTLEKT